MLHTGNPGTDLIRQLLIGIIIGAALTLIALAGFPQERETPLETVNSIAEVDGFESETGAGTRLAAVGQIAPNFKLRDLHDRAYELRAFQGRVVLLNFWATWCGPCRLEMPLLEEMSQDLAGEDFIILAVNLEESAGTVQAYIDEMGLTFPVLLDPDGQVSRQYRILGYPSTIIIDGSGKVRYIHTGIITEAQIHEYLVQVGVTL